MEKSTTSSIDRFVRREEVTHITGLKKSSIYERVLAGTFPKPVKLTDGSRFAAVAWLESEIREWQAARIASRNSVKK